MQDAIKQFITDEIMHDPDYILEDDEPLVTGGLIGSVDLVRLQLFIEEQFNVRVPDIHFTVENTDNLNLIITLIQTHQ